MLETIAIILVILWLLGLVSSYTLGGFIHILLVLVVIKKTMQSVGVLSIGIHSGHLDVHPPRRQALEAGE